MTKQILIESSERTWASSMALVKNTDGSTGFCVDDLTKIDSFSISQIDDLLDAVANGSRP